MMVGSLLWNLLAGIFGFFFAFTFSWITNTWQTSIIRGSKYFLVFFIITFLFRVLWLTVVNRSSMTGQGQESNPAGHGETQKEFDHKDNHGEEISQRATSQDISAKETSEMIRSLLNEDEIK